MQRQSGGPLVTSCRQKAWLNSHASQTWRKVGPPFFTFLYVSPGSINSALLPLRSLRNTDEDAEQIDARVHESAVRRVAVLRTQYSVVSFQ